MYTEVEFMSHAVEYCSWRNRRCMCQRSENRTFSLEEERIFLESRKGSSK